ncbi:MAG: PH domain-containing protein [Gemmatimonadota bacterium]|nr:PH domain-containing protein [Gemmatimonadota bacterium]
MQSPEVSPEAATVLTAPEPAPRQLDPRVVTLWRAGSLVSTTVMTAVLLIAGALLPFRFPFGWVAAAVATIGVAEALFWPPVKYRAWSFAVRESDLFVSHGVLWRTTSVFPLTRIQHVDTRRGPLERWLGLARLIVYTAGVRGADLEIPGLALAEAEALRDYLAALSGGEDAV